MFQSMHWSTPKTKDRMLPETSGGGSKTQNQAAAARRASEGGVNLHWGNKGNMKWNSEAPSEVVSKFRNYEI